MYEKPEVKVLEISDEDIIQTSSTILDNAGPAVGVLPGDRIEFSLTSESDATGNVFQK